MAAHALRVPYFIQPTPITCQSTCLKMMAMYLEREVVLQSTGAEGIAIEQIWQEVNGGVGRPSSARNAHANFKWWLEKRFPSLSFEYIQTGAEDDAASFITKSIDARMPVLMSVSHERVAGHIILIIGYEDYLPNVSAASFRVIAHDPYGRFDPELESSLHGKKRDHGAMSLTSGSESGPGMAVHLPITSVGRRREFGGSAGKYILLIPRR
ncbi:MAG: hypothetical protein LKCHEGNO_00266 [Burkholderiaceae bacterium]|nr:hypothetical protein [Burkholderiaceae bacterium]